MTTWIILIRESQKWMIRHLASQAIVVLRSTGVWNSGDRLLVVIERCSSVAHAWANRPVYRWLQQQAGLTDFKLLTVHPTRLTRRSNELDEIVNYLHAKGGQWLSRGVPNQPRDVLANPMESSTLPALRQLLDESKFSIPISLPISAFLALHLCSFGTAMSICIARSRRHLDPSCCLIWSMKD